MYPRLLSKPLQQDKTTDVPPELGDDFIHGKKELKEQGLIKQKAQLCVLLDISASMQVENKFFYGEDKRNRVQEALNRILALSFMLDDNQQIDIIPFGRTASKVITVNRSNYKEATTLVLKSLKKNVSTRNDEDLLDNLSDGTNYAAAIRALRLHYFNEEGIRQKIQSSLKLPVFAIMLTDGEHNIETDEAENQFKFSSYQNIFIKTFGLMGKPLSEEEINKKFKFLNDMDNAKSSEKSLDAKSNNKSSEGCWSLFCGTHINVDEPEYQFCIDNSDFVPIVDPSKITMKEITNEFRGWLEQAHKKGISTIPPKVDKGVIVGDEGRVTLHR